MSYTYDADGLRLSKTVGTVQHRYVWQGGRLVSDNFGGATFEFFYDESGRPYGLLCTIGSADPEMAACKT